MRLVPALTLIAILFVIGCSTNGNPTSPQLADPTLHDRNIVTDINNDKYVLGMWNIQVDESRRDISLNPLRMSEIHVNMRGFLEHPAPAGCLEPGNIQRLNDSEFSFDLSLKHPLPDSIRYTVFDVRGILMLGSNFTFPQSDKNISSGTGNTRLLNADGYTDLLNSVDLSAPEIPNRASGLTVNPENPASTLHPFRAFNPNTPRRIFFNTDEDTLTFHISAPSGPVEFSYTIDACWSEDPDINDPLVDFPANANCEEAYRIDVGLDSWPTYGESSHIQVQVYDHQGKDTIGEVSIESPGLFDGVIVLQEDHSCNCSIPAYEGLLPNDLGGQNGQSPILVKVTDSSTDGSTGEIAAYHVIHSLADVKLETETDSRLENTSVETESGALTAGSQPASSEISSYASRLLAEYESDTENFHEYRTGDLIVCWSQQFVANSDHSATVQNAQKVYQFDEASGELVKLLDTWRNDLPQILPAIFPLDDAEALVGGEICYSGLFYMSEGSNEFPISFTSNPLYVICNTDGDSIIIDAVAGVILGDATPTPVHGFTLSGPQYYGGSCSGVWYSWYMGAAAAFRTLGYPALPLQWPSKAIIQEQMQDDDTRVFYELAHGSSYVFGASCVNGNMVSTSASNITVWLTDYEKKDFTFIGSCGGMCATGAGSLSYAFRKGSGTDTATVGYCGMAGATCSSQCWYAGYTIPWQNALFGYMEDRDLWTKYTVYDAFLLANADYPAVEAIQTGVCDSRVTPNLHSTRTTIPVTCV